MLELHLFAQTLTSDYTKPAFAGRAANKASRKGPDPLEQAFVALQQLAGC